MAAPQTHLWGAPQATHLWGAPPLHLGPVIPVAFVALALFIALAAVLAVTAARLHARGSG